MYCDRERGESMNTLNSLDSLDIDPRIKFEMPA